MDCFNHSCPFRVNETSNANRCECVACQNRSNGDFIITSNRTLTDDEMAMLTALRSGDKNYLIANDVTVQEWISVYDELPEVGGYVVCIAKRNPFSRFMPMVARIKKNGWVNPITEQYISEVTHWMPLPNPPKGE